MKKFVICTNRCGIMLSDEHLEWLHTHCRFDTDFYFDKERDDLMLIACIEAVRAKKQHAVEEGQRLWDEMREALAACNELSPELVEQIDFLLAMLDFKPCWKRRITMDVRRIVNGVDWRNIHPCAKPKGGISAEIVKEQLFIIIEMANQDEKLQAAKDASERFDNHMANNGLTMGRHGQVQVDDGFEIKSYDETKFVASVNSNYAEHYDESDYETMSLKPYLSHSTLASFVDARDADGLFDFVKSLNVGGFMDIRDDRPAKDIDNADCDVVDEEIAQLLRGFGIPDGKSC